MNLGTSKGGTNLGIVLAIFVVFVLAFAGGLYLHFGPDLRQIVRHEPAFQFPTALEVASIPTAARFDFPLGSEHGALAYNAQPFTENRHLGDDLNGIGGENSDLGDPVYSIADGRVIWAAEGGPGWGNIVIVLHAFEEGGTRKLVQSYYAHLQDIGVAVGQTVARSEKIGTVGSADGRYRAHLHFEMREFMTPFIGP
ncbi:MAG TPA: M23 family metallopeptidase, partial [Chthoniobacterales bacterium]